MANINVLEAHVNSLIEKTEYHAGSIAALERSKVSTKEFWSIMGLLYTITAAILSFLTYMIKDIGVKVDETNKNIVMTQVDVSAIKGKLDPYEVKYTK